MIAEKWASTFHSSFHYSHLSHVFMLSSLSAVAHNALTSWCPLNTTWFLSQWLAFVFWALMSTWGVYVILYLVVVKSTQKLATHDTSLLTCKLFFHHVQNTVFKRYYVDILLTWKQQTFIHLKNMDLNWIQLELDSIWLGFNLNHSNQNCNCYSTSKFSEAYVMHMLLPLSILCVPVCCWWTQSAIKCQFVHQFSGRWGTKCH